MQPTSRILERDRQGYYWADPEPPAYPCSNAECREAASDQETYHKCEACQKQFCADCLTKIGDLEYCPECSVCDSCAQSAMLCCADCGELVCGAHAKAVISEDCETGYRTDEVVCRGGCRGKQ